MTQEVSQKLSVEVSPRGVLAFDQFELFQTRTAFQLLFACDGVDHGFMDFVVHQFVQVVAVGEAFGRMDFVLLHPLNQIGGDADVQRAVRLVGQDVDSRETFAHVCFLGETHII